MLPYGHHRILGTTRARQAIQRAFHSLLPTTTHHFQSAIAMLRAAPRFSPRSIPRGAGRSSRRFAAQAGHSEQLVLEGNPTKEWIEQTKNVEHHAAGLFQFLFL